MINISRFSLVPVTQVAHSHHSSPRPSETILFHLLSRIFTRPDVSQIRSIPDYASVPGLSKGLLDLEAQNLYDATSVQSSYVGREAVNGRVCMTSS